MTNPHCGTGLNMCHSNFVLPAAVKAEYYDSLLRNTGKGSAPNHTHRCRVVGPGMGPRNNFQFFITTASEGCALRVITDENIPNLTE